jgi:hypothetical protein
MPAVVCGTLPALHCDKRVLGPAQAASHGALTAGCSMQEDGGAVAAAKELEAAPATASSSGGALQERLASNAAAGSSSGDAGGPSMRTSQESLLRRAFSERSANLVQCSDRGSSASQTAQEAAEALLACMDDRLRGAAAPALCKQPAAGLSLKQKEGKHASIGGSSSKVNQTIPSWRPAKPGRAVEPARSHFVLEQPVKQRQSEQQAQPARRQADPQPKPSRAVSAAQHEASSSSVEQDLSR